MVSLIMMFLRVERQQNYHLMWNQTLIMIWS